MSHQPQPSSLSWSRTSPLVRPRQSWNGARVRGLREFHPNTRAGARPANEASVSV